MSDFENISSVSSSDCLILNNRYKLEKKIGEGSYGKVYKAKDIKDNDNLVAIKQVSKMRINRDFYLIEALKKELSIMKFISSENSVKLIEDFETEDNYNFVMELCDSDLDEELKKNVKKKDIGFNELEVYEIMTQFNNVFLKMQKERIIHRDLKLKNILIKYNKDIPYLGFAIKLSDFGFSKFMDSDLTGTNLGSPATKAPEIMIGKEYNAKADLWSVGVIIFQLFFNRLPFPASNIRELKYAIFNSNGVKLPENSDNPVSDICFDLINRLLQKDPNNRINFEDYFQHKFFSEEHKNELIKNLNKKREKKNKK
jgi:serine/threonine-protein kinase ULK/ATG1